MVSLFSCLSYFTVIQWKNPCKGHLFLNFTNDGRLQVELSLKICYRQCVTDKCVLVGLTLFKLLLHQVTELDYCMGLIVLKSDKTLNFCAFYLNHSEHVTNSQVGFMYLLRKGSRFKFHSKRLCSFILADSCTVLQHKHWSGFTLVCFSLNEC